MAKDRERKMARILYVDQKKTAKETAMLVGVSEKTMCDWVAKYKWKTELEARTTSPGQRISNIENIISGLAEDRIDLGRQLVIAEKEADKEKVDELRKNVSKIDDAVSKWAKTLRDLNKEAAIPLVIYLDVMQSIFQALQNNNLKLYMQTLNFQETHIHDISLKLSM